MPDSMLRQLIETILAIQNPFQPLPPYRDSIPNRAYWPDPNEPDTSGWWMANEHFHQLLGCPEGAD